MARYQYVVLTKAVKGKEEEFHEWYDKQHIPDCLKVPGVIGARRYRLNYAIGPSNEGSKVEECPYDGLALYEMETDDPVAVARELSGRAASPDMPMTDAIDRWASVKWVAEAAASIEPLD